MSERPELEGRLADLAGHIEWPEADVAPGVMARITAEPVPAPALPRWVAAVAVLVVVAGSAVLTPSGRSVIADLLGVVGIEVRWAAELPDDVGSVLDVGRPVGLAEAAAVVDFPLLVPADSDLGAPDGVFLRNSDLGTQVTTLWASGRGLPASGSTGVAVLHTQFRGRPDVGIFRKLIAQGTEVRTVSVRGVPGRWISGVPHSITYLDPQGGGIEEPTRLAGDVLLWTEAGVTHRIESALPLDRVLAIAESLGPLTAG